MSRDGVNAFWRGVKEKVAQKAEPTRSWWVGADRETFYKHLREEEERLKRRKTLASYEGWQLEKERERWL